MTYDYDDDQGFHGSTADTVFVVNCTGSDGPWNRQEWTLVEDDIHELCEGCVDECQQEILEGFVWDCQDDEHYAETLKEYPHIDVSLERREEMVEELYEDTLAAIHGQFDLPENEGRASVLVTPWYAAAQRNTFWVHVNVSTYEEVYG